MAIRLSPISPHLGAEVDGIDLSLPLANLEAVALQEALVAHQVLVFRNQPLDYEGARTLGRVFGELHIHPNTPGPEGYPEILPIHADATSRRVAGERWHSDVSCDPNPPFASILYLHTVPPVGGDTLFASQYAAYDALSSRLKTFLEGLTALHDGGPTYRATNAKLGIPDTGKTYPSAIHPVIRTNPANGRRALFVNEVFTQGINELPEAESEALLAFLFRHATRPDFQIRLRWQPHSVAIWDNRFVQHLAIWDYFPQVRSGFRVTVRGDRPI
ncbi:taurine dioxygenase [Rhodovastum atsumiense]|uniref:Taurine dioxygenase n=1 Tax=Rhodovastum atsumiense TaxID=504468 RepID=A0A5M6IJY5_9PROT|nr:TauD/TfdA family dioxygenase [Rhodovastum atsumiense]KAA5608576.1 taurine dioxygenase [Rhodovastum atsumiense]CAH2598784.1 taurine dioxygenase [Rhodovastum atsumiense]